jgi:hypothetical protein
MTINYNSYVSIVLIVTGVLITSISLLALYSSPILILGISLIPIGLLLLWNEFTGDGQIREVYNCWDNMVLLLEDLGIVRGAVYLPSSYTEDNKPMAIIPLTQHLELGRERLPLRFSVRYGGSGIGILVYTPGSKVVELCREGGVLGGGNVETSINSCLANYLSVIRKAAVEEVSNEFRVEVVNPRLDNIYSNTLVERVIGTPIASAVASIVVETLGKPVVITREERRDNKHIIYLASAGVGNVA